MGSLPNEDTSVNLLAYLRSKTQVDCDSLDLQVAIKLGPFVDCTGNQAESYSELLNPQRAALLKSSAALSRQFLPEYPNVTYEELAFEISMVSLSLSITPHINGSIHVMANPTLCRSTPRTVENAQRLYRICKYLDPSFDTSRLIIKVASTWEGLQACRELTTLGIKTLATTVFTMEQVVLAAEVGCVSISPFVHELKVHFDSGYHDTDPILDLCVRAQNYYKQHSYPIKVKACSVISVDEILQLAGVAAFTIAPDLLYDLAKTEMATSAVAERSLFNVKAKEIEFQTFVDDEVKFRTAFSRNGNGKGESQTNQAINIFWDHQLLAEEIMRTVL